MLRLSSRTLPHSMPSTPPLGNDDTKSLADALQQTVNYSTLESFGVIDVFLGRDRQTLREDPVRTVDVE